MSRTLTMAAFIAAAITAPVPAGQPQAYALIMVHRGNAYALDTGLTLDDCLAVLPAPKQGESLACEIDPHGFTTE